MPRDFLPPPSGNVSYPVPSAVGRFVEGDGQLLSDIGANMAVAEAQTEGRVPSPLSRAYMFYTALFGRSLAMTGEEPADDAKDALASEGRLVLQERARATFRGLCAVFALRDALGLDIQLRSIPLVASDDPVARVLRPNLHGAPGGEAYWQRVRLFTVRARTGGSEEVLAGLSPLTSFFPAANPPAGALAGVFWYTPPNGDSPTGRWYDPTGGRPTGGSTPLSASTRGVVRAALKAWVDNAETGFDEGGLREQGVTKRGAGLLRAELKAWRRDLSDVAPLQGVGVAQGTVPGPDGEPVPPFLLGTCQGVGDAVLSDLPLHHGRLVVSAKALSDPTLRMWGPVFGERALRSQATGLPRKGPNLGAALGLGDGAVPVPFVVLDKLFTPRFTLLTQNAVSKAWRALPVENHGSTEYALFPFEPEALELLSADELVAGAHAELSQDTLNYKVRLRVGDQEATQLYATSGEGEYAYDVEVLPDTVDLRLFPDFDIDAVRDLLPGGSGGAPPDAKYHARARLGPEWTFAIRALHVDEDDGGRRSASTTAAAVRVGGTEAFGDAAPPGEADFFVLDRKPDGFWFERRGLCLLDLRPPPDAELNVQRWDVGVDFGTSNTCVAYRPSDGSRDAAPFEFPVLTTTLLERPIYGTMGAVNEGHSAVADFFFNMSGSDRDLVSPPQYPEARPPYFPTQVVTRQTELPTGGGAFDLSAGLILFQNGILSGVGLLEVLKEFDLRTDGQKLAKRFYLRQDIKWSQRTWLRAFMAHLRLQVVLTAAYKNARVEHVVFSYPKAFNDQEEQAFETVLRATWGDIFGGLESESEAVRTTLGGTANQHLVLDIGGGTTDVIGFDRGRAVFQTSFRLAAGHVNAFVVSSAPFRRAFRKAVERAEMLHEGRLQLTLDMFEDGTDTQLLNVWTGLLQTLEYHDPSGRTLTSVTSALAEAAHGDDDEARAVRGFFLTTAILFGGLAYASGRLQGLAAAGVLGSAPFALTNVRVAMTGNGSKLIELLSSAKVPFEPVFQRLFRAGLTRPVPAPGEEPRPVPGSDTVRIDFEGVYTLDNGVPAPKATVALGLISGRGGDDDPLIPVANALLEQADGGRAFDSLVDFYESVRGGTAAYAPGSEAPAELAHFLDALNDALPNGHNGKRMVIPGVGPDWHRPLKTESFAASRGVLLDRLRENAEELPVGAGTAAAAAYVPALEPVFVAEVAALLHQIQEDHA